MSNMNRRRFLKTGGAALAASSLLFSLVEIAFGKSGMVRLRRQAMQRSTGSSAATSQLHPTGESKFAQRR